jgi:hypothetical protein
VLFIVLMLRVVGAAAHIDIVSKAAHTPPPTSPLAPPGVANFTLFETQHFDRWMSQFRCAGTNEDDGCFSYLPGGEAATVYGLSDYVLSMATVGRLSTVSPSLLRRIGDRLRDMQDPVTGEFAPSLAEYPAGYPPWHASAFALSALRLLNMAPLWPPSWAQDLAASNNESRWEAAFGPQLTSHLFPTGIWTSSHFIAAVPAALLLTTTNDTVVEDDGDAFDEALQAEILLSDADRVDEDDDEALLDEPTVRRSSMRLPRSLQQYERFFTWWLDWLNQSVDVNTGFWCADATWCPPSTSHYGLGGAFHMVCVSLRL